MRTKAFSLEYSLDVGIGPTCNARSKHSPTRYRRPLPHARPRSTEPYLLHLFMSSPATDDQANPLEAQLVQLTATINNFWQKMKMADAPPADGPVVVCGISPSSETPQNDHLSAATQSRLWFTYRSGFEPIARVEGGPGPLSFLGSMIFNTIPSTTLPGVFNNQAFCTDVGWGCMIRTSQSLLANSLQSLVLGRDFIYLPEQPNALLDEILALFADDYKSPFSLHNFIRAASQLPLQVKPGEWFGPSAVSLSIKRLCDRFSSPTLPKIKVMISEGGDLYDSDIQAHFLTSTNPILLIFPIRLGIENVNEYYHDSLFQLLSTEQCVGIAGGKPSSSYYFYGYKGRELLFLDPHHLQAVSTDTSTYHTPQSRSIPLSQLDPSMLIGFAVTSLEDYAAFRDKLVGKNKILYFHKEPKRRKPPAGEDYVKVPLPHHDSDFLKDFVNVSDLASQMSAESGDRPSEQQSETENSYDVLEAADVL